MVVDEEALRRTEEGIRTSIVAPTDERRKSSVMGVGGVGGSVGTTSGGGGGNGSTLLPEAPHSNRLPMKVMEIHQPQQQQQTMKQQRPPPRLLHPILLKVPMHIRFGLNGFVCNCLFMVAYNSAVVHFGSQVTSSTIYSIVYLIFIPITHAFISLLVFGWPERYIPSLMSNTPIGLTAIAMGAALTAYLDRVEFNKVVVLLMAKNWSYLGYKVEPTPEDEKGEFYSSLFVLLITGVWTFILSVIINAPSESTDKKEQ